MTMGRRLLFSTQKKTQSGATYIYSNIKVPNLDYIKKIFIFISQILILQSQKRTQSGARYPLKYQSHIKNIDIKILEEF